MRYKPIYVVIISFLLTATSFVSGSFLEIKKDNVNLQSTDIAELPEWSTGNYWKYNMNFVFKYGVFSIDATVNNMLVKVIYVDEIKNEYVLNINAGGISGTISISDWFQIGDLEGDYLNGNVHIEKSTLAIKDFTFESSGTVTVLGVPLGFNFLITMTFNHSFNFFGFPIDSSEGKWAVNTNASLYVEANVGPKKYSQVSESYFRDNLSFIKIENIGLFKSFLISGELGYRSKLWYSPDAGYLVKVDEGINWLGMDSVYNLDLVETNYDVGNHPPNTPDTPSGPNKGLINNMYSYITRTTDREGDDVYYWFDWGDGSNSGWVGPYNSGSDVSLSHAWVKKGIYNIIVKAKDESGIESQWSTPFSVVIGYEQPYITLVMHRIEKKDEIDVYNPLDPTSSPPEWYYKVTALSESLVITDSYHNTKNGLYSNDNSDWNSTDIWEPGDKKHELLVKSRNVVINIKLMDHDDPFWEGGDDLADVSGCNYPDNNGFDNGVPDKRGAIWAGTYDMGSTDAYPLKPFSSNPLDYADFWEINNGYYLVAGDNPPDSSTDGEGPIPTPENDAAVWFTLYDNYNLPEATAQIVNTPEKIRPGNELQFIGIVSEGASPFTWSWDFGDGTTSDEQNPTHAFNDKGTYLVTLTVTDGINEKSSYSLQLQVQNNYPTLSNDHVTWTGKGSTKDTFTFSVCYVDTDNDDPKIKNVIIDGEEKTMNGQGNNAEYVLDIQGSEIGNGQHTYYFYFEDGYGGSARTQEKTFNVQKTKSSKFTNKGLFEKILNKYYEFFTNLFPFLKFLLKK